ncbi:carbamate kinase [Enterococcus silesiacus]|uniref:Carbamate kinase n=1 Tax=Enterococcus silesiacus TaxID=332949 RepID=A0A0S3K9N6_9ENTE|nr:carbamate kinase [Enterococcus silesiacus]ALS00919.1 carbamate kinase [Enterococcus silesiacus]OJG91666.1 carbamate kinase [Enterococcus silesiacus]
MKKTTIVIALGGNAILSTDASAKAQQEALTYTAKQLVKLIQKGYQLVISHGNGPQVGNLLIQQQATDSKENPAMPLDTCVAMTQGSIGYWLENALAKEVQNAGIKQEIATLVTQVIVSENDPAFEDPTKPIGPFLSQEKAQAIMNETNTLYKEDAGRGWRKVVPSPKPLSIQEHQVIKTLIKNDILTICGGGGGIPISGNDLTGVEAVIDKDFSSEKIAELADADLFVILTGVENVAINYGKENEQQLKQVSVKKLEEYIKQGQFEPGSMLPKVEAAIQYVKAKPTNKAVITSLEKLSDFGEQEVGTEVVFD